MSKKNKKNQRKISSNYKSYHRKTKYALYLGLFLVLILSILLLVEFSDVKSPFREATYVEIVDECSLIMGNLVHQIGSEDDCTIRCYNECELMDSNVKDVEFEESASGCNSCDCYCK